MSTVQHRIVPQHVAIIMDGNGRWANARGLPRTFGHRKGVETVRETVKAAGEAGVSFLTLFAFSSENWRRPESEVNELFGLLKAFIRRDLADLHQAGVRIRIIGDRENLREDIRSLLIEAEDTTAANSGMTLVIAFNYGSRDEIARAAARLAVEVQAGRLAPSDIDAQKINDCLDTAGIPDPDLVIRTSGEERLSNFLLWQAAYAELMFVPDFWPDFTPALFNSVLERYAARDRRFGGLSTKAVAVGT
ncbi:undecaprenyl diphosphate synthase [Peteryoungia aggregata LMG 23059]|uniref:Isoprenyl transferase n=1 Tax=Peteryoungia aggregata LMG 23059 TaxID=1368425 RepID=A0ABU0G737_9HYPH|nr:isoprenyl transferase [Peteryoungia aggregata]MDQ0421158.1 undecaprenyl diphosphate synthase [Peteryoungia aggregata LMG 23059]